MRERIRPPDSRRLKNYRNAYKREAQALEALELDDETRRKLCREAARDAVGGRAIAAPRSFYAQTQVTCSCGRIISTRTLAIHQRSRRCVR